MSDVAAIEQAILNRLSPLRSAGLLVRALPNQSSEVGTIEGTNGAITVSWSLDEAQPPNSIGFFTQDCAMSWVLDIRLRNLRESSGAWAIRKAIYGLLVGFQPPGCKKMYARRYEFVDRTDAVWRFEATFIIPTVLVEVLPPNENLPLLKDIFLDETVNGVEMPLYPLIDSP